MYGTPYALFRGIASEDTVKLTSVVVSLLALSALTPAIATAQFTTFVSPGRAKVDSAKQVVAAARAARTDSTARMTLTNMKAWVDSAAGVTVAAATTSDTTASAAATPPAQQVTTTTTTFSPGAVAPNTASPLPLLVLLGALSSVAGLLLLRAGRRRAASAVVRERRR